MVMNTPLDDLLTPGTTTAFQMELKATVIDALRSSRHTLNLGEDAFLAVLSADEWGNSSINPEDERFLPPRACAKKKTEFVLGRAAAGYALRELGEYGHVSRG